MRDQKHNFALYYSGIQKSKEQPNKIVINDSELVHRVIKILRLQIGDELTLFADQVAVTGIISQLDKKSFVVDQADWRNTAYFVPEISVALGVLKKENFENALYSCAELGANQISPIIFAKSVNQKLNQERLEKIIISAAEQSKNFNLPLWHEPVDFLSFLKQIKQDLATIYVYCDVAGSHMFEIINQIKKQTWTKIVLIIGPEGDLTNEEKKLLSAQPNVLIMSLTPTVLRSFQAVTVALGALRSLL